MFGIGDQALNDENGYWSREATRGLIEKQDAPNSRRPHHLFFYSYNVRTGLVLIIPFDGFKGNDVPFSVPLLC